MCGGGEKLIKMIKRSHAFVTICHAQRHHMWAAENRHYLVIDLPTLVRFRCDCERHYESHRAS